MRISGGGVRSSRDSKFSNDSKAEKVGLRNNILRDSEENPMSQIIEVEVANN